MKSDRLQAQGMLIIFVGKIFSNAVNSLRFSLVVEGLTVDLHFELFFLGGGCL